VDLFYFAHRIPYPPDKGDKIRSFHQIRELSARHRIRLFCLVDAPEDRPYVEDLARYCLSVDAVDQPAWASRAQALLALLSGRSLSSAAFWSAELRRRVAARLREGRPDAVLIFSGAMAPYLSLLGHAPAVLDLVDVDSDKWNQYAAETRGPMSWIYRAEAERLSRLEVESAGRLGRAVFVSSVEANLFRERAPGCDCVVIPNGVDLDYFHADPEDVAPTEPRIVFVGMMDYFPNVDAVSHFCADVFPLIQREIPEARFDIVGRNPTRPVLRLGRLPGVRVTGSVPDVRPYVRAAALAVAPFRVARGLQNKVLEAMALRRPVVGTALGFQGTVATPGDGIRIADDPARMAAEIVQLLRRGDIRSVAGGRARAYVERTHRWEVHGLRLEELLREAAAGQPAAGAPTPQ
jgi:sugar transferase (PEP-CTERM/EpsH1 system associated)